MVGLIFILLLYIDDIFLIEKLLILFKSNLDFYRNSTNIMSLGSILTKPK
jgi:hypothetical protein